MANHYATSVALSSLSTPEVLADIRQRCADFRQYNGWDLIEAWSDEDILGVVRTVPATGTLRSLHIAFGKISKHLDEARGCPDRWSKKSQKKAKAEAFVAPVKVGYEDVLAAYYDAIEARGADEALRLQKSYDEDYEFTADDLGNEEELETLMAAPATE